MPPEARRALTGTTARCAPIRFSSTRELALGAFDDISPLDAFAGHAQCDPDPWLNGLSIHIGDHPTFKASFHPNTEGQRDYANLLEGGIANYRGPNTRRPAARSVGPTPAGLPRDPKPTRHLPTPPTPCVSSHPC